MIGAVALLAGAPSNAAAQTPYSYVEFAAHSSRVGEDAGTVNLRVNINPAPRTAATLNYTVGGTATEGSDFTTLAKTVTVPANARSVVIPVTITDDTTHESSNDETIIVRLSHTTGSDYDFWVMNTHRHWIYVRDNDTPTVSFQYTASVVGEGTTKNIRVNLNPAPQRAVEVDYAVLYGTASSSDVSGLSGTVQVSANASSVNIPVTAVSDADRGIEWLHLQIQRSDDYHVVRSHRFRTLIVIR